MKKNLNHLFVALLAAFCLGCGNTDPVYIANRPIDPGPAPEPTVTPTTTPTPEVPMAHLRVVNANFFGENLTVLVDGVAVDTDFDPFETTGYIELEPGQHEVEIQGSILVQALDTLVNEEVDLEDGDAVTLVVRNFDEIMVSGQNLPVGSQILTDDVTPTAGQLNARLLNSVSFESEASLLSQNEELLLGPVRELNVTSYGVVNVGLLQGTTEMLGLLEGPGTLAFTFSATQGDASGLVEALLDQLSLAGVNITCILAESDFEGEFALIILIDDIDNGGTPIVSISDEQEK